MNGAFFEELAFRNRLMHERLDPSDPRYGYEIPASIHRNRYHSLFPLEDPSRISQAKELYGFPSSVYKAMRMKTSEVVCLRRMHGCVVANDISSAALEKWFSFRENPNVVGVQEVFCCREFGDGGSLCFVYDYYPGAVNLFEQFIVDEAPISLDFVWSIVCQLVAVLSSIHAAGLAYQVLDAKRVLLTAKGTPRIRLNCLGIEDIVRFGSLPLLEDSQALDVESAGLLVLYLITKRSADQTDLITAIEFVGTNYSKELGAALQLMILHTYPGGSRPTIFDVSQFIHARIVHELQSAYSESDAFSHDLSIEAQNGRLFRLLAKFLFINERPEFDSDPLCTPYTSLKRNRIRSSLSQGQSTVIAIQSNCSEISFSIR